MLTPSDAKEQQQLLAGRAGAAGFIPDLVVTFPRLEEPSGQGGHFGASSAFGAVEVETFFNEILVNWDVVEKASSAEELYPACTALQKELEAGAEPRLVKVQNAMISDLMAWLGRERGCSTVTFMSCDDDELFLLISLGDCKKRAQDDSAAMEAAEDHGVKLQTTFDTTTGQSKLKIRQQIGEREEMYIVYSKKLLSEMVKVFGFEPLTATGEERSVVRKYHAGLGGVDGSVMRTVDRSRVLMREINTYMDLEDALGLGLINDYYVPHKLSKLIEFRDGKTEGVKKYEYAHDAWSNFRLWTILKGFHWEENKAQPIQEIRDYFGERVGFYFLWLGFTVKALCCMLPVTAVFAVLGNIYDTSHISAEEDPEGKEQADAVQAFVYMATSFFFSNATMLYIKFWSRLQSHYAALWESEPLVVATDAHRPDYRGELLPNPLNENKKTKQYPGWKALLAMTAAVVATATFTFLIVGVVFAIYWLQSVLQSTLSVHYGQDAETCAGKKYWGSAFCTEEANLEDPEQKNCCAAQATAMTITSLLLSVQITVVQKAWDSIHLKLVELANPRTEDDEQDLSVQFLFPFSFFSTYVNIFFHAFYTVWNEPCMSSNCLNVLRPSMYKVVLPAIFLEIVFMLMPFAMYRHSLHSEVKALREKTGQETVDRSFIEVQAKRPQFGFFELYTEVNIMMLLLGFIFLFGFAAPLVTSVILVTFVVKIRIDAFKLCSVYQRMLPGENLPGLGKWNDIMKTMATIGHYTAFAIPVFNLEYFNNPQSSVVRLMRWVGESMSPEAAAASAGGYRQLGVLELGGVLQHPPTALEKLAIVFLLKGTADMIHRCSFFYITDVAKATQLVTAKRTKMHAKLASELMTAANEDKKQHAAEDDPVQEIKGRLQETAKRSSEALASGGVRKLDAASAEWQDYESGDFAPESLMQTFFGQERA